MFDSNPVIKVREATVFQEEMPVLNNLSFEIAKGEFSFLIGRTGSGKSSLLKTLYADLPLRVGAISVAGFDLKGIKVSQGSDVAEKSGHHLSGLSALPGSLGG